MSVFLQILRWILCCDEEHHYHRDDEIFYSNSCVNRSHGSCDRNDEISEKKTFLEFRNSIYYHPLNSSAPSPSKPQSSTTKPSPSSQSVQSPSSPVKSSFTSVPLPSHPQASSTKLSPSTAKSSPNFSATQNPSSKAHSSYQQQSSVTKPSLSSQAVRSPSSPVKSSFTSVPLPSHPQPSLTKLSPSTAKSSPNFSTTQNPSSKAHSSSSGLFLSRSGSSSNSPKSDPTFKYVLSVASPSVEELERKDHCAYTEQKKLDIYNIPENIRNSIKKGIVPDILNQSLSPSTYKDYFSALLYSEEFHLEKWSDFLLKDVTLEVDKAVIRKRLEGTKYSEKNETEKVKRVVLFKINSTGNRRPSVSSSDMVYVESSGSDIKHTLSTPERRPFLLSRDFVYAQPVGSTFEKLQGVIHRVVKSSLVLVEFGDDFYRQHIPSRRYNISFSFNRVCLKRAHQAIEAASNPSFKNFLFPDHYSREIMLKSPALFPLSTKLDKDQTVAVRNIVRYQGPLPYLVKGPLLCKPVEKLSRTGMVIKEAIIQIYHKSPANRVLVCAPINMTCDVLTIFLKHVIPQSDIFRANAAFRELDGVPLDVLPSCTYEGECFSCPSFKRLSEFRVILSTYISSFRLHNAGLVAGHFSHIFLVDASSATEPEMMVAMSKFACETMTVVVTGAPANQPGRVRSEISRRCGLKVSYFERVLDECRPYKMLNSTFMTHFDDHKDRPEFKISWEID